MPRISAKVHRFWKNLITFKKSLNPMVSKKGAETIPPPTDEKEEKPKIFCTPYVKGFSENLERGCGNINIRPVFKTSRTLRSLLVKVKKRIPQDKIKGVIYRVQCECGSSYMGETGRTLETRLKEHKRAIRYDDQNKALLFIPILHAIPSNGKKLRFSPKNKTGIRGSSKKRYTSEKKATP